MWGLCPGGGCSDRPIDRAGGSRTRRDRSMVHGAALQRDSPASRASPGLTATMWGPDSSHVSFSRTRGAIDTRRRWARRRPFTTTGSNAHGSDPPRHGKHGCPVGTGLLRPCGVRHLPSRERSVREEGPGPGDGRPGLCVADATCGARASARKLRATGADPWARRPHSGTSLIQERARAANRVHKLREDAGIKLRAALSRPLPGRPEPRTAPSRPATVVCSHIAGTRKRSWLSPPGCSSPPNTCSPPHDVSRGDVLLRCCADFYHPVQLSVP
jgi:hypothetical protein